MGATPPQGGMARKGGRDVRADQARSNRAGKGTTHPPWRARRAEHARPVQRNRDQVCVLPLLPRMTSVLKLVIDPPGRSVSWTLREATDTRELSREHGRRRRGSDWLRSTACWWAALMLTATTCPA